MSLLLSFAFVVACDDGAGDSGEVQDTGSGDTDMDTDTDTDSGETGETGETGDTNGGTGYQVTDDESAAAALVGANLPASLVVGTFFLRPDGAGCPDVVDDGVTATVTGNNCTSESGMTYNGTVVLVQGADSYTVTFGGWAVASADFNFGADGGVNVDGDLVFSGTSLTANYQRAAYGLANRHDYTYTDWAQQGSGMLFLPTNFSGGATIDGEAVAYSGSWDWTDTCTSHPSSGSLVASGTNVTTFTFVSQCDECTPWTTDDGLSGEWCPA